MSQNLIGIKEMASKLDVLVTATPMQAPVAVRNKSTELIYEKTSPQPPFR